MAPIRRYLRITKYSVLEVRIYLEKPSDAAWLLSSRDPVLPRVISQIRPKVLPKLREEYANSKKKGAKKKRGIKDVINQDDFEVVLFLTDSTTRHSIITKHKQFADKPAIKSTGNKLTGWLANTSETPIDVDAPRLVQEESEEMRLEDIPEAAAPTLTIDSSDEDFFQTQAPAPRRGRRTAARTDDVEEEEHKDDKKKLGLNTSYDGFSLYGKILCLIVKRKGNKKKAASASTNTEGGSQMMESWISTQVNQQADLDDD